jgi:hypothetical protein
LPKPTVHSRHSCGTVEIVRESTYDAGEAGEAEGERGLPAPARGEVGIEENAEAVAVAVVIEIEVGVAPPGAATRWLVFKDSETRPSKRSSNLVSILSSRPCVCNAPLVDVAGEALVEDAEAIGNSGQRLSDLHLLRLFDVEQGELDVFRERLVIVSPKNGIGPDQVGGEFSSHNYRIL